MLWMVERRVWRLRNSYDPLALIVRAMNPEERLASE
jgi:hypothetical protein